MKKLITLLACLYLSAHLTACTSKDTQDEANGDAATSETAAVDGELAKVDGGDATANVDAAANPSDEANAGFLDEQLPEDALGENKKDPSKSVADSTTPPPAMDAPTDAAKTDGATPDGFSSAPPVDDAASTAAVDTGSTPPADATPSIPTDGSSSVASSTDTAAAPVAGTTEGKPKASLKKVKEAPFKEGDQLLNAVYVARPKDNYSKVSKMIYGSGDKVKDLKKANPAIKTVKVGDKVYYNSPSRPTDDQKMLTYYEDSGMVPEVYVAKDGDDLKKVSKELLGFDNAWKEVWVTNAAVDSKSRLAAGTELRYWKAPAQALPPSNPAADVAMNTPPKTADMPPPPAMNDMPPPPPPDMNAAGHTANNPAPPSQEAAPPPPPAMNDLPPPPPPLAEAVNPPPPPAPMAKKSMKEAPAEGMDNDMMMALAGAAIVAAGLAAIIVVRKRRQQKDMASAFNDTQVGT